MSAPTTLSLSIPLEMRVLIDLILLSILMHILLAILWYILLSRLSSNVKIFETVRIFLRAFLRAFDEASSLKQSIAVNNIRIKSASELKKTKKSIVIAAINISSNASRSFSEISSEASSEALYPSTRFTSFIYSITNQTPPISLVDSNKYLYYKKEKYKKKRCFLYTFYK